MKFERLKALYEAGANVHYKGKLCEIIGINYLNHIVQVAEVDKMFSDIYEVEVSDLN